MATAAIDIPFALGPALTEEQTRQIVEMGEDAAIWAMLQLAKLLAEGGQAPGNAGDSHTTPATPSGMKPPFKKPNNSSGRKKKPGRKKGHVGSRRSRPERIDHRKEHRAKVCPECGGALNRRDDTRTRYTEDIPENIRSECTEHTIHRDWCPNCQKKVEPTVDDALPGCSLGLSDGALGLAALRPGQHALANHRGVELSSPDESHSRRAGADVVSAAGDPLFLVRRDSKRSPAIGRVARRRNGLAGAETRRSNNL